jgi:hypothetical protein
MRWGVARLDNKEGRHDEAEEACKGLQVVAGDEQKTQLRSSNPGRG